MSFALNLIDSKNQIQNSIQSNPINFLFSEFLVNSIFDLGFYFLIVINPVNKKKKKHPLYKDGSYSCGDLFGRYEIIK